MELAAKAEPKFAMDASYDASSSDVGRKGVFASPAKPRDADVVSVSSLRSYFSFQKVWKAVHFSCGGAMPH